MTGNPGVSNPSITHWFNPAAFADPAYGTFGSEGRNTLIGPGFTNIDLSIAKEFTLHWESVKLGIRADAYNIMNHINFANPDADVGYTCSNMTTACGPSNGVLADPTAGTITGPAGGNGNRRIFQLGARLTF